MPVVGGHSGATIIPVLSALKYTFTDLERDTLVKRIQFGGDEVVQAKEGAGSATLSMAFAGAKFVDSLIQGSFNKKENVKECTYINCDVVDEVDFFSAIVELGPTGVEKFHLPHLDDFEKKLFSAAVPELKKSIAQGVEFVTAKQES